MIAEGWIPFEREISVLVARSTEGEIRCFPVVKKCSRGRDPGKFTGADSD
ncbi:MAG TPA: hypothetical protein DGB85_11120 [Deltaproteobacteria bacterium]|nr:hypothetical protein [Deltaproteobacteria bacterium]